MKPVPNHSACDGNNTTFTTVNLGEQQVGITIATDDIDAAT